MKDTNFEQLAKMFGVDDFLIFVMQELDDCEEQLQKAAAAVEYAACLGRHEALIKVRDKYCELHPVK